MTRRTLTPVAKKRIAIDRHWRAPEGGMLCLENRKVVFLATGKLPEWDHIHPLAIGGSNDDDNFQPIPRPDHKRKSRDDAGARGKVRRLSGANKTKRKYYWPKRPLGIPGLRKKFDGTVVKA